MLLARALGGTHLDLEATYRRYGPMVLRRCKQLLRDDAAAADAHQEVFVQLVTHHRRLTERAPSSLLNRMATNVCLNRIRARQVRAEVALSALDEIAHAQDLDERLSAHRLMALLFGREPESTRVIAVLHLVDGLTLEETAREVGLSVSGVRKRLRRLKARGLKEVQS